MTLAATIFAFCVACTAALVFTSFLRRLSISAALRERRDSSESRKLHRAARSQIGGLAILLAWMAMVFAVVHLYGAVEMASVAWIRSTIPALVLVACVGLVDDVESLGPGAKLGVELIATALLLLNCGIYPHFATLPWYWQMLWLVGGSIWALGLTNATNFIDGLDGLASGVTTLSALGLAVLAHLVGEAGAAIVAAGIAGVSLGFLRSNVAPARVFLGDTGSLFLGMALAAVGLRIFARQPTPTTALSLVLVSWVAWGDMAFAILRRARQRVAIWRADQGHVHHRLVGAGLPPRLAVASLWILSALATTTGIETFRHSRERVWASALLLATLPVIWAVRRASTNSKPAQGVPRPQDGPTPVLARERAA